MKGPFSHKGIRASAKNCHTLHGSFELIKEVFDHQAIHNEVFNRFLTLCGRPTVLKSLHDLTFLPIQLFKDFEVKTGSWQSVMTFESSGTTGQIKSQHFVDDLNAYHQRCAWCFSDHTGKRIEDVRHIVFMPFYQANPNSSLLSMMNFFVQKSQKQGSCFVKSEKDLDDVLRSNKSKCHTYIWTVTYGVLDYINSSKINLSSDMTIIETGGMKGSRQELSRDEIHKMVRRKWPEINISSEYGMCELFSQAYWKTDQFYTPNGLFVLPFALDDPFSRILNLRRGQLCFIDMANVHSCSFIATQDMGRVKSERQFEVDGRIAASDLRGCNLMYS